MVCYNLLGGLNLWVCGRCSKSEYSSFILSILSVAYGALCLSSPDESKTKRWGKGKLFAGVLNIKTGNQAYRHVYNYHTSESGAHIILEFSGCIQCNRLYYHKGAINCWDASFLAIMVIQVFVVYCIRYLTSPLRVYNFTIVEMHFYIL